MLYARRQEIERKIRKQYWAEQWFEFADKLLRKTYTGSIRDEYDFCTEYNSRRTDKGELWFKGYAMIDKNNKLYICRCGYTTIGNTLPKKCPICKRRKWNVNDLVIFKNDTFIKENLTLDGTCK